MHTGEIMDRVQPEYFGRTFPIRQNQEAARKAWRNGEPVTSPVYGRVGRLVIVPGLLERALEELKGHDREVRLGIYNGPLGRPLDVEEKPRRASDFLIQFMNVCSQRFAQVVSADVAGITSRPNIDFAPLQVTTGGPYEYDDGSTWHRDSERIGGLTYTITIAGPTTLFATSSYHNSQFAGITSNEMFHGLDPTPEETRPARQLDIMVHDQALTLHRAPGEEHNGETRIFSRLALNLPPATH
jgi:hypothetical protein